jgi:epoxide hydrolase-like predicted phosphatase
MQKVQAIIFDCFGVLVGPSLEPFRRKYFGGDREKISRAKELEQQSNKGHITYTEFVAEMAGLANITVTEARRFLDDNPPNIELLDYIRDELKPRYKIGFLSNASDDWLEELFTSDQAGLFDDVVLSFEQGIAKPDPTIFRLAARRLGAQPAECVFVDDIPEYCEGAQAVGMQAIRYSSFEQFQNDLAQFI